MGTKNPPEQEPDVNQASPDQESVADAAERSEAVANTEADVDASANTGEIEPAADPKLLAEELDKERARADQNWDKVLLVSAEMENLRRRTEKDLEKANRYALEKFAKELLNVVDSLEIGLQSSETEQGAAHLIHEGMKLTLQQMLSTMKKFNIEQIDPVGEPFNPEMHQAMSMQPSDDVPPNSVLQVFQKGYQLNDRLLRPAMVVVSQAASPQPQKKIDEQA